MSGEYRPMFQPQIDSLNLELVGLITPPHFGTPPPQQTHACTHFLSPDKIVPPPPFISYTP